MKLAVNIWKETLRVLKKHPKILVPFLVVGTAHFLLIYLIYSAPQRPLSSVFAPPIRTFFGEKFLHYPFNFFIFPKLFNYGEIALSALVGIFMTALAIGMIADVIQKQETSLLMNSLKSIRRYCALFGVWILMFLFVRLTMSIFHRIAPVGEGLRTLIVSSLYFLGAIFVQLLFIYAIPLIIIKKKKLVAALRENTAVLKKLFFPTMMLVMLPAIFYIPIVIVKAKAPFLVYKFFPEIILAVFAAGVALSLIIDVLVITSTTLLFLRKE